MLSRRPVLGPRAIVGLAAATRLVANVLMGTALAVYVGERGSPFAVSAIATAYYVGIVLFAPIWGTVADVTGRRRTLLVVTGGLASITAYGLTVVEGPLGMIGLRGAYAVFAAGFAPVMLSIVSARGGTTGRGREVGFFNSASAAGVTFGEVLAGTILGLLAPDGVFAVIAGVSLVSTLVLAAVTDPTPTPDDRPSVRSVASDVRERLLPSVEDRGLLRSHGLRWLYVALALRYMTVFGVLSLMAPYLIDAVGVSTFLMGVVLAINPGCQTAFMYLFGRVADAAGRKPLIVGGMVGSAAFAWLVAAATVPEAVVHRGLVAAAALALLGASYSAMTTGSLSFIGDVAPAAREGELMGLRSTARGVGGVFGPPLVGVVATLASYRLAFVLSSVLTVVAVAITAVALVETRPEPAATAAAADD